MAKEELGMLEKMIKLIDQHGIIKILKACFLLVTLLYVSYNGANLNQIVEEALIKKQTAHDIALEYRRKLEPEIRMTLTDLYLHTRSDRAFVIEMHNGNSNITGLPFYKGAMTYEEVSQGTEYVSEDYDDFNLSRFPFLTYVSTLRSWSGPIDSLSSIDRKLALKLLSNNVNYLSVRCMYNMERKPFGFVGITYVTHPNPTQKELNDVKETLIVISNELTNKLDMEKAGIYK